jgi:hypothetical protein
MAKAEIARELLQSTKTNDVAKDHKTAEIIKCINS